MQIEQQHILNWLSHCATVYSEQMNFLTDLDKDIGDADHGLNMNRGFQRVAELLPSLQQQNIATILKNTGMKLLSSIGGASGPLYGTLFIRAADAVGNRENLTINELLHCLSAGVNGVIARGKAEQGDKTMCDVWVTVIENAKTQAANGLSVAQIVNDMVSTAEESVVKTIQMRAKKGRASYLGERSIGHQDPGATSSMLMIKALRDAVLGS